MKKSIIVAIIALAAGLLIGRFWFGGHSGQDPQHNHNHSGEVTEYTCSMHPNIRQNEPGKCPICGMDLIPVDKTGSGIHDPFVLEMTPEAVALSNIRTMKISESEQGQVRHLQGRVSVDETVQQSISARFGGRIERLYINFTGREVSVGEKVAELYAPELITAAAELKRAAGRKDRNPEIYAAAKSKLKFWNLTDSQIAKLENGEIDPAKFPVVATANGVITQLNVAQGDYVQTGQPIANIAPLDKVWIELDAYEGDLTSISVGNEVRFAVATLAGEEFTAKVQFVDPVLNPATRTAKVRAEAQNKSGKLKPGTLVKAKVSGGAKRENQIVVPQSAVLWTGKRSVVYVQVGRDDAPAFRLREVTLGAATQDGYLVKSGIKPGDLVVVNGVFAIDGAAQLSGNFSMMNLPEDVHFEVPEHFKALLTVLAQKYFALKDALVETDAKKAQAAAREMESALQAMDDGGLEERPREFWHESQKALAKNLKNIVRENDVEKQREAFYFISNTLRDGVERFGINEPVFLVYCPMADNDRGAYWLSAKDEVLNPYFGDVMLRCGEVKWEL